MNFAESTTLEDDELDINITPLIDIVFLLLIFFMVSTTFVESAGISVALPSAQSAPVEKDAEPLTIAIKEDGSLFLKDQPVALEQLEATWRKQLVAGAPTTLVVRADKAANHGTVVTVMDTARAAGVQKLAVAVSPQTE